MNLQQDIEALKGSIQQAPVGLAWARTVCVLARRIMHQIVLSPIDDELARHVYSLFEQSLEKLRQAEADAPDPAEKQEIHARVQNVQVRVRNLDKLLRGEPLEPAEELVSLLGSP